MENHEGKRRSWLQALRETLRRWFKKSPPEDPHAYVTAKIRPRKPNQSATAVADLPEE